MELTSDRLVLRPVEPDDLDFYVTLRNHPELHTPPRPRDELERELQAWIEVWREQGFGPWTVFDRATNERLGRVELDEIGAGWPEVAPDEVELGCVLHPAHWNQGIATEATRLAIDDLFRRSDRPRVIALTTTGNPAALRALEKLGMSRRGETRRDRDETTYLLFELAR